MAVNATEVLYLTSGLFKAVPSKAVLTDLVKFNGNIEGLAASLGTSPYAVNAFPFSNAEKAKTLAENLLGSSVAADAKAAATTALEGVLNANGGNVGIAAVVAIKEILKGGTYADAKAQLENRVKVAAAYVDSNKGNEISTSVLDAVTKDAATVTAAIASLSGTTGGNEAGADRVLTIAQDLFTGTAGNDNFRAVAGVQQGQQDQTTLNSSDIIDGAAGADAIIVNMTGNLYQGGARLKNIETLQIGTNLNGLVTFDYNVNQGQNEITEVTKVVYDQINQGENQRVINLLKTGDALPTLAWTNEANSSAGNIQADFRQSAIEGTSTALTVELNNVLADNNEGNTNGRLDIGAGIETLTIVSGGTSGRNTLDNSTRTDGRAVDIVSAGSSTTTNEGGNDDGSLKKVIVTGSQTLGKVATVVTDETSAAYGLTNRAQSLVANNGDLGRDTNQSSTSNLVSVAATVTEIDATAADGGVAMRFSSKVDQTAQNVTFKGGKGADYIEFQLGNVNAEGGEGADTFAFVTTDITNFGFGSADSIKGGAGSDTILLGMNGLGNVVANTTEFNDKTGIEVLDLRGAVNTVTLADAFVAGADTGTFTVRTDRIVQTSDTDTANKAPSTANDNRASEDNSVNTIVLTELADNRAVEFIGGSGADRVVVDNASANQFTKLDGGANRVAGVNDSLTIVNTARLDANDVANIKGFELLNVVETSLGNNSFDIEISEAFLLANSSAGNTLTIASVTGTYGQRLGAGDVVNLEISNLLSNGVAKASINGRVLNIQDLIAAGVTVNFQQNGVTLTTNAAPAALTANVNTTTAPAATLLDDVTGAVAGAGGVGGGLTPAGTAVAVANATAVNGTAAAENFTMAAAATRATVNGGAGTDWLTVSTNTVVGVGSAVVAGANVYTTTNVEAVKLADGGNAGPVAINDASTLATVVGGNGADTILLTALASGGATISLGDGADTLQIGTITAQVGTTYDGGASTSDIIQGVAAFNNVDLSVSTVTGFERLDLNTNAAVYNYTLSVQQYDGFTAGITGGANDTITFSNAGTVNVGLLQDAIGIFTLSAAGNTISIGTGTAHTVNGAAGNDVITGGTAGDSLTGGAGNDTITGGAAGGAGDTINGGTGVDTLTGTAAAADTYQFVAGDSSALGATFDTITNWVTASDIIDFTAGALVLNGGDAATAAAAGNANINATGFATFHAADTTVAQRIAAVAADLDAAPVVREVAAWQQGADTYIYVSDGVAGVGANDVVIVLTGVTVTATGISLTAGDITAIA